MTDWLIDDISILSCGGPALKGVTHNSHLLVFVLWKSAPLSWPYHLLLTNRKQQVYWHGYWYEWFSFSQVTGLRVLVSLVTGFSMGQLTQQQLSHQRSWEGRRGHQQHGIPLLWMHCPLCLVLGPAHMHRERAVKGMNTGRWALLGALWGTATRVGASQVHHGPLWYNKVTKRKQAAFMK
jgi:hypothetical protein